MCCKTQKAVKLMKELDADGGIGLIEKKRLGLGKPNVIYVKNFLIKEVEPSPESDKLSENLQETGAKPKWEIEGAGESTQSFQSQKSGVLKIENQEFPESKSKNFENHTSEISEIKKQELRFSKSNNTDINKTDLSDTEFSETEYSKTELNDTDSGMSAIHPNPIPSNPSILDRVPDVMEEMAAYRDIIREHISYECFQDGRYHRREDVDELVELMVEVMMLPDNGTVRVAGVDKPTAVVKNRFMKLNHEHIEYILTCLGANTTKVGNIKAYLLTTLYNAPMTISNYYTAEVNHDLYGSG